MGSIWVINKLPKGKGCKEWEYGCRCRRLCRDTAPKLDTLRCLEFELLFEDGCLVDKCVNLALEDAFDHKKWCEEEDKQSDGSADHIFVQSCQCFVFHVAINNQIDNVRFNS